MNYSNQYEKHCESPPKTADELYNEYKNKYVNTEVKNECSICL